MSSNISNPANPLQTNSPSANPPVTSHEHIPSNLITKNPMRWSIEEVQSFLSHNRERYYLKDADIDLIRNNELVGIAFLNLTREDLRADPYNMSDGRARVFQYLISTLKEASKEPNQHLLELPTSELIHALVKPQEQLTTVLDPVTKRRRLDSHLGYTTIEELQLGYKTIGELFDLLTQPFHDFPTRPTADSVDDLLSTPLTACLPYPSSNGGITADILSAHPYLLPCDQVLDGTLFDFTSLLVMILSDRAVYHGGVYTEDNYHCVWDDIITQTLFVLSKNFPSLEFTRNSTDRHNSGTTMSNKRPDFLCWMRGTLVLRGEEKSTRAGLGEAYLELTGKFGEWSSAFYGKLPFVFAYTTGGTHIQFCLLMPDGRSQRLNKSMYDANFPSSRLSIFCTIINIVRCLRTLEHLLPPDPLRLWHDYIRPGDVTIWPTKVIKRLPSSSLSEEVRKLYDLILTEGPTHIINLLHSPSYRSATISLHLSPVGFAPRPRTIRELKNTIGDVLKGLKWMHGHEFVHRDIRWANLIWDSNGRTRLIDLEYAGKEGPVDFILNHWPPLTLNYYSKQVDLKLVASLINYYETILEDTLDFQFVAHLQAGLGAEAALADPWFLECTEVESAPQG